MNHSFNHSIIQSLIKMQDWLSKWAVYSPNYVAIKEYETGKTFTYSELNTAANQLANVLTTEYVLRSTDRVAIMAENCAEYVILLGVAQKTGIIIVPLNYRLAVEEIDYLLNNATPKLIIWEAKFAHLVTETPYFQTIEYKIPLENLTNIYKNQPQKTFPSIEIEENQAAFILYTSGTTGFPKGAIYSHKMLFWNSVNTAISLIINTESRTVNCMPPFHTGGLNVLLTPFLHHGGFVCLMKQFDAKAVLELLGNEDVTLFMGVPTILKMMADEPYFAKAKFPKLKYLIVGGEPMPIPLIEKWAMKNVPVRQGYGMTEVGPNLTSLHQDDAILKKGSIGRANFYVQTKVVNEKGEEVAPNESGELLLKGPMVTPGYWQNETATQKAIKDGWFYTGDRVRQDEAGYFYVVDRIKNMFISGGENVYPAEVERILIQHEAIAEVAVIGVKDKKWGEVGKAFVVLNDNQIIDLEEIKTFCHQKLSKFKIPKYLKILKEMPKNASGKVDKKTMIETMIEGMND
jgi:fatty-acyl-CoA synthase